MATEYVADDSGFDDTVWDGQSITLTSSAFATRGAGIANRSGVLPSLGDPLAYVSNGDMTGTLKAGAYWVASPTDSRGGFLVVVPTDQVFTHPTAASAARTDFVIVEVAATGVAATSFKKVRLHTVSSGGGTPVLPVPSGVGAVVLLHTVAVAANATAIGAPQDLRTYTAAAGGVVSVKDSGATAGLPTGTPLFLRNIARPAYVTGAAAGDVLPAAIPRWRQDGASAGGSSGATVAPNGSQLVDSYSLAGCLKGSLVRVEFTARLRCAAAPGADSAGQVRLDCAGRSRSKRWNSHNFTSFMDISGTLDVNPAAAGAVLATVTVTNDQPSATSVTVYEVQIVSTEYI